ncbi:MAG: SufE family protein [Candidatus Tokpelaia sp.]|nr:MAG: SufE family protein [Candidatus Tokpelaia sp.]KAA6207202.1 MAG: SufE family protein [Candidatus Tokpelaia sp.]
MQIKIEEIEADFALLENWEERYRYIIELGGSLAPYPEAARDAAHKLRGCVSQVWLLCTASGDKDDPVLHFKGDSDAHIVKGLIAIVLALYSGRKASAVRQIDAVARLKRLGLEEHLTPQRSNGLRAMIGRIRAEAEQKCPGRSGTEAPG